MWPNDTKLSCVDTRLGLEGDNYAYNIQFNNSMYFVVLVNGQLRKKETNGNKNIKLMFLAASYDETNLTKINK